MLHKKMGAIMKAAWNTQLPNVPIFGRRPFLALFRGSMGATALTVASILFHIMIYLYVYIQIYNKIGANMRALPYNDISAKQVLWFEQI